MKLITIKHAQSIIFPVLGVTLSSFSQPELNSILAAHALAGERRDKKPKALDV
jgi:hypothetical protein